MDHENSIETLQVQDFLGIKKIKIEIKDFNLLIGPQATGKSVIAKLLFYFKDIIWKVLGAAEERQSKRLLEQLLLKRFEELFPPATWGAHTFDIKYQISDLTIQITKDNQTKSLAKIVLHPFFQSELTRLRKTVNTHHRNSERIDDLAHAEYELRYNLRESITASATQKFGRNSANTQLFIPAGRSFFSNLQSNIFSFLSGNNAIDPLLKEFGSFYENTKRFTAAGRRMLHAQKERWDEATAISEQIICGKYVTEKGKDYLNVGDGRKINLGNCSSGQQETLPLVLILRHLASIRSSRNYTLYIEEPEAHLFPTSQRKILELIALTFNSREQAIQTIITTHSPYILTALNNLLQAGSLYSTASRSKAEKLKSLVPRDLALNIDNTAAYCLNRGHCIDIIDRDMNLLRTDLIDEVSTDLAIEFDKLLEIEHE